MLDRKNQSLRDIIQTLRIYHSNVDDPVETAASDDPDRPPSQKEILEGLISALDVSDIG